MRLRNITFDSLRYHIGAALFFILNRHAFKRLGFGAIITKPLRINGKKYISLHENVKINNQSWLVAHKIAEYEPELIIHEGCNIGDFNHIAAVRRVILEKFVLTANRVYISDNLHSFEDVTIPIMHQPVRFKAEVRIGEGSWIGENVCILGATIGKHCIIGANAVVTSDIPDYSVAVGIPARVIRKFNHEINAWE